MTMTMSSKSVLKSLSLFPSPFAAGSTKPQNPNHITLKPSLFSKPFLQIQHKQQQPYAYANTLLLKSAYNVQVVVADRETEDRLVERFRRTVLRAGVIQEAKRRRFFETTQDKRKRKARDAARRNRKRRYVPKAFKQGEKEQSKEYDFRDDNWDITDIEVPYC